MAYTRNSMLYEDTSYEDMNSDELMCRDSGPQSSALSPLFSPLALQSIPGAGNAFASSFTSPASSAGGSSVSTLGGSSLNSSSEDSIFVQNSSSSGSSSRGSGTPNGLTSNGQGSTVSLVIRGKTGEDQHPGVMDQHADVILSNGEPAGFFGEGGGASGSIGLGMDGVVADYDWYTQNRPNYVDGTGAENSGTVSTVCSMNVTPDQAAAFDKYWRDLQSNPGGFDLLGNNCSTHAASGFDAAGLMDGGIPGLDTPDNLYAALKERYGDAMSCQSGYVGFQQLPDGTWTHTVTPVGGDGGDSSSSFSTSNPSFTSAHPSQGTSMSGDSTSQGATSSGQSSSNASDGTSNRSSGSSGSSSGSSN